ncbi:hypothetical protein [Celeribacter indicus]|uniref:hypothetical protein n=1 Tax=Celeribacter indicus TaxID=1208324 RepID=UPI001114F8A0|nr:hypothetical protein [Celeribacter indicus]
MSNINLQKIHNLKLMNGDCRPAPASRGKALEIALFGYAVSRNPAAGGRSAGTIPPAPAAGSRPKPKSEPI